MKKQAAAEIVTIENVGPIKCVEIPLQPGRVTLLTGSNGAGKTQSLKAINALAGSETDQKLLTVHDGSKAGRISGLGREVKLTLKQTRSTGDVSVAVVEDGFSLQKFLNPGYATAEGNDKARLQNLASVCGIEITKDAIVTLLGGTTEYSRTVSKKTIQSADPAAMVASLKKDCDVQALESEKLAAVLNAEAETLEGTLPTVTDGETDADILSKRLADAMIAKSALVNRQNAATEMAKLAAAAKEVLNAGQGETVEQATAKRDASMSEYQTAERLVKDLESQLLTAKEAARQLFNVVRADEAGIQSAKYRQAKFAEAEARLKEQSTGPTDAEFEAAQKAVAEAEEANFNGRQLREAVKIRQQIAEKRAEATKESETAERLRQAGKSAINLLVDPINELGCGITIDDEMRLVFENHKNRGRCYFDELSEGEKCSETIKIVASAYGDEPALFCLSQESFESLDESNVKLFLDAVAETNLMVVAAKASEQFKVDENGVKKFVETPVTAELLEVE